MFLTEVAENEINTIIGNFNDSSPGWDDIAPSSLKWLKKLLKALISYTQ